MTNLNEGADKIKSSKEKRDKSLEEAALFGATQETVGRFGNAVKEHVVSYAGKDHERGTIDTRSLKKVAESKINRKYRDTNIKQQSGFSAEIKAKARANADAVISGKKNRTERTDDMNRQTDSKGRSLGSTNDQLFDLAEIDNNGIYIEGSARQLKFVGENPKECADILLQAKYDKYRDADVEIEIPKDFFEKVNGEMDAKISKIDGQIKRAEENGDIELANKRRAKKEKIVKTKNSLRKSSVTSDGACEARLHPKISVFKDVVKVANKAGLEQAQIGALISGSTSIIRNTVACIKDEKDPEVAAKEVLFDTGKGAAFSYATAFSGAIIKGRMLNSTHKYVRGLSQTALPGTMVMVTVNVAKTMSKYIKGEISGTECIEQLGEKGFGELGAAMYSTVAVAAVRGTGSVALKVVAGMAGSTVGYAAAVYVYQELATALKEHQYAIEERRRIEAECEETIKLILQYRAEMNETIESCLKEYLEAFNNGIDAMDKAIAENDVDGAIAGNAVIQKALGYDVQFINQKEFDVLMDSDDAFVL